MNFFQHQEEARKTTRKLIFLFALSVVLLIFLTNVVLISSLWFFDASIFQKQQAHLAQVEDFSSHPELIKNLWQYFEIERIASISVGVVTIISLVIFFKRLELNGGGKVIAQRLGGKLLSLDSQNRDEKIILNVVEEMAIASGIPAPPVYLLPDMSINAFAAGFNTSDAVIGISKGAMKNLNRDQLQGVVAHEFSHILNGDMRLNINLIAVLSGILFIGESGWFIVRSFGGRHSRRSSRDSGSALAIVGFLLIAVGYVGTFFGSLIKAAVSRQREFLADASAVQFTRNPQGIGGALKLIAGSRFGSRLNAPHAHEMSHLFFSNAISSNFHTFLSQMLATHPPLEERIRRIEPNWDGLYLKMTHEDETGDKEIKPHEQDKLVATIASTALLGVLAETSDSYAEKINQVPQGEINAQALQEAELSLEKLEYKLQDIAHTKEGAQGIVYAMLLSAEPLIKKQQIEYLKKHSGIKEELFDEIMVLLTNLQRREKLSLFEILMPALKGMDYSNYQLFLKNIVAQIKIDGKIELFEWILHRILVEYLKPQFQKVKPTPAKYRSFKNLKSEVEVVLSFAMSRVSNFDSRIMAFNQACQVLELYDLNLISPEDLKLDEFDKAVTHFTFLFPLLKPKLLKACVYCMEANERVDAEEYELLRALSIVLDCPMPLIKYDITN